MLITNKLQLRKELINLTEKDFYIQLNDYELNIFVLGESYFVKKQLLQSSSEYLVLGYLKLNIKDELITVVKDLCKLKSSELIFCSDYLDNNLVLKYKRTKKDEDYSYLNVDKLSMSKKEIIETYSYFELDKYLKEINKSEFINENIYTLTDLNNKTIYEFDVIKVNNQNINNKDIERLNKIFNEETELIISNNNEFIKFTNLENTIEYYTYICENIT